MRGLTTMTNHVAQFIEATADTSDANADALARLVEEALAQRFGGRDQLSPCVRFSKIDGEVVATARDRLERNRPLAMGYALSRFDAVCELAVTLGMVDGCED